MPKSMKTSTNWTESNLGKILTLHFDPIEDLASSRWSMPLLDPRDERAGASYKVRKIGVSQPSFQQVIEIHIF
jgi:hypothetical protein